jgi:hypothetical protein
MRRQVAGSALACAMLLMPCVAFSQSERPSSAAPGARVDLARVVDQLPGDLAALERSHRAVAEAALKLADLYGQLAGKAGAVATLAAQAGSDRAQLVAVAKQLQEMQMSFNLQYLQLQSSMQNDNRQFTMVSNIMKTKHDTVKNSISNIR